MTSDARRRINIEKKDPLQWVRFICGLAIYAFGTYFLVKADLGLAPWEILAMGISYHCPLTFGQVIIAISIVIFIFDLIMREKIGVGMIFDVFLVGTFADMFLKLDILPQLDGYIMRGAVYIAGLTIMCFGQFVCMSSAQGVGPRDAMLIGIGKRVRKVPIGAVQFAILLAAFLTGWALGGPAGIGTIISVAFMGSLLQLFCRIFRFEPRDIVHKSLADYFRAGKPGADEK